MKGAKSRVYITLVEMMTFRKNLVLPSSRWKFYPEKEVAYSSEMLVLLRQTTPHEVPEGNNIIVVKVKI
jgi:hypothetical protein